LNFVKIQWGIRALLAALVFFAVQCCSPLAVKPPVPPLTQESVASILSAFEDQERAAETLFFAGTLNVAQRDSENSVQILMIADRRARAGTGACPYGRMKIEITHPWGKALIHILMEDERLDILDFAEKRFYRGSLKSRYLIDRLPVPLNPSILWSLARAFPALLNHQMAASLAGNQITLLDSAGDKVQVLELYSGEPLPYKVFFVEEKVKMVFSHFEDAEGILFARQVRFHGPDHGIDLGLEINQMTFNTPLPEAVFDMEAPPDFKTVRLRDDLSEH
jgi:hypothetical protein